MAIANDVGLWPLRCQLCKLCVPIKPRFGVSPLSHQITSPKEVKSYLLFCSLILHTEHKFRWLGSSTVMKWARVRLDWSSYVSNETNMYFDYVWIQAHIPFVKSIQEYTDSISPTHNHHCVFWDDVVVILFTEQIHCQLTTATNRLSGALANTDRLLILVNYTV